MAQRPPQGGPPPGGGQPYFVDQKKGEVNELKAVSKISLFPAAHIQLLSQLLRNINVERDAKRKREIIKKVIAYMTLGIDVSRLFSEMVMVSTPIIINQQLSMYSVHTNYPIGCRYPRHGG